MNFLQLIIPLVFVLVSCSSNNKKSANDNGDFDNPVKIINLPFSLKEISGLSFFENNKLLCHQDENSSIYIIDYQTEEIIQFGNYIMRGDFEDIVYHGESVYLLKSNGKIYEFEKNSGTQNKPKEYTNKLNELNDCEGLTYDKQSNSLLIACKGKSTLKDSINKPEFKSIFRFDLDSKKFINQPFISISMDKLSKEYGLEKFSPSGIAVHPKTGQFYVLSSGKKSILVMDRTGKILKVYHLKSKLYTQPEGICFDPEGNFLFISNEGKKSNGNLLVFKFN